MNAEESERIVRELSEGKRRRDPRADEIRAALRAKTRRERQRAMDERLRVGKLLHGTASGDYRIVEMEEAL